MRIIPKALTPDGFAPYGRVPDSEPRGVNEGRGTRRDLAAFPPAGVPTMAARYDLLPTTLPFRVALFERHAGSDQLFVALGPSAALVVVTLSLLDGSPDLVAAEAFIAEPDTPFVYAAGIWHAPLASLDRAGSFLMCMTETGTAADCETFTVTRSLIVAPPGHEHGTPPELGSPR